MKIKKGNHVFGMKTSYEQSQHGNVLLVKQKSNLPLIKTFQDDIDFRPLVGMYKNFCEADLMEARSLINAAESGIKPKRIDHKAIWASYGDNIIFSLLKGNLRVLSSIRDSLEKLELGETEDIDGTEAYHPD